MKKYFKRWWRLFWYEPNDPVYLAGHKIKVAAIGGGTGLSILLRGLKEYSDDISAIVAMTDSGSSTGILRKEFNILPPGDIRKCICALSDNEKLVSDLLNYRFKKEDNSLANHTLGNIWLTALTKHLGSFEKAVEATSEIFQTSGKVLPATIDKVDLKAIYQDKTEKTGEANIPQEKKIIKRIKLSKKARAYPKAVRAIANADLIVIGPGSLYTSIIPNLLIPGIRQAISKNNKAIKIYIANCSTERGETENFTIKDHIRTLRDYSHADLFDYCLVNNKVVKTTKQRSELGQINNIATKAKSIDGCQIINKDVVDYNNPLYHNSKHLAREIIKTYSKIKS